MPFPPAPRLDDFGRDDIDEDFGEGPALGVAFEMVRRDRPSRSSDRGPPSETNLPVVDHD